MRTERRTAKDPVAFVATLQAADDLYGWAGKHHTVVLVSVDGRTPTGRLIFTVGYEPKPTK
jgi:hypothetical protein